MAVLKTDESTFGPEYTAIMSKTASVAELKGLLDKGYLSMRLVRRWLDASPEVGFYSGLFAECKAVDGPAAEGRTMEAIGKAQLAVYHAWAADRKDLAPTSTLDAPCLAATSAAIKTFIQRVSVLPMETQRTVFYLKGMQVSEYPVLRDLFLYLYFHHLEDAWKATHEPSFEMDVDDDDDDEPELLAFVAAPLPPPMAAPAPPPPPTSPVTVDERVGFGFKPVPALLQTTLDGPAWRLASPSGRSPRMCRVCGTTRTMSMWWTVEVASPKPRVWGYSGLPLKPGQHLFCGECREYAYAEMKAFGQIPTTRE